MNFAASEALATHASVVDKIRESCSTLKWTTHEAAAEHHQYLNFTSEVIAAQIDANVMKANIEGLTLARDTVASSSSRPPAPTRPTPKRPWLEARPDYDEETARTRAFLEDVPLLSNIVGCRRSVMCFLFFCSNKNKKQTNTNLYSKMSSRRWACKQGGSRPPSPNNELI